MRLIAAVLMLTLIGCGGRGGGTSADGPGAAPPEKSVFSKWTEPNTGFFIDLTGGSFGVAMPLVFIFKNGAQCGCSAIFTGNESTGTYMIADCQYAGGGGADPGCGALNEIGTYTKTNNVLTACAGGGGPCTAYH